MYRKRDWNSSFDISQKILEKIQKTIWFWKSYRSMIGLDKFDETKELIDNLAQKSKIPSQLKKQFHCLKFLEKPLRQKEI